MSSPNAGPEPSAGALPRRYRGRDWLIAFASALAAATLSMLGRAQPAAIGQRVVLPITLVPNDSRDLECSSTEPLAGRRCSFGGARPAAVERPLRPFTTTYHEVMLLQGVFETPRVAGWVQQALRSSDEARVTFTCDAVLLGVAPSVAVRWHDGNAFEWLANVPIATVQDCRM
jgi:hypothetical protein